MQRTQNRARTILEKNKIRGLSLPEFKTSKYMETKTLCLQCKDRQNNETEQIPEIDLNSYVQLILDKGMDAFQ